MRHLLLIISSLFLIHSATAQGNIKSIVQENKNFYEVQEEANAYFDEKYCYEPECLVEDSEYHKYKRWEWYWKDRVDEKGNMPNFSSIANSVDDFKSTLKQKNLGLFEKEKYDWTNITQTSSTSGYTGMGRATSVAFHPTDRFTYYVGAPQGGIWKTTTRGAQYVNIGKDLPYVSVGNILIDPISPDTLYISVGDHTGWWNYGLGIYKTEDGGETWVPTVFTHELSRNIAIIDMAMSPKNSKLMIVATGSGLYRTEDGFETIEKILDGEFNEVKFNPLDSATVMATLKNASNSRIIKSKDGGKNWKSMIGYESEDNWVEYHISYALSDTSFVYALGSDKKAYKSTDGGETFYHLSDVESFGPLIVSGVDKNKLYCGFISLYESTDGALSWKQKTNWYNNQVHPTVHADCRNAFLNPHNPEEIFFCNDGGIYLHDEGDNSWMDLSNGLIIMQYYKMSNAQTNENICIGGTQDNGGRKRLDNGNWEATNGGDAMEVAIDPTDHNIIYTTYINGLLYRSRDFWEYDTYHCISCNIPGKEDDSGGSWVTPYLLDPNDPNTIVAAYEAVYKSLDQGDTWTAISPFLDNGNDMDALAIAPSDSKIIATSSNAKLFITRDGGLDWVDVFKPSGSNISSITFHPEDPDKIWLTLSGYNPFYSVLFTEDGGLNWVNQTLDFPNVPINTSAYLNTQQGEIILIGTDIGLFVKTIDGDSWERYGTNLPFTHVSDIEFQNSSQKIRISTYGLGIWETDMPGDPTSVSDQELDSGNLVIYPNPLNDWLNISSTSSYAKGYFNIVNIEGRIVKKIAHDGGNLNIKENVQDLKSGLYLIQSNELSKVYKFSKLD